MVFIKNWNPVCLNYYWNIEENNNHRWDYKEKYNFKSDKQGFQGR